MAKKNYEKIIEALLFASDKPLPARDLAQAMEATHKQVEQAIDSLKIRLKETGSPITIKEIAGGYELLTLPDYAPFIKKLYKNRMMTRLSRAALEVLSIVAYKQPITKQEVELIRGVNSDGVYHTLLERKLIKITGRKDTPGRPLMYGSTKDFLQYLGLNSLEDLPKIEEIKNILEKDENVENWDSRVEEAKKQTLFGFTGSEEREKTGPEEIGSREQTESGEGQMPNAEEEQENEERDEDAGEDKDYTIEGSRQELLGPKQTEIEDQKSNIEDEKEEPEETGGVGEKPDEDNDDFDDDDDFESKDDEDKDNEDDDKGGS